MAESLELIPQYEEMHADPDVFRGQSILAHGGDVMRLIIDHGARDVLDYGCGKGAQYWHFGIDRWWGVLPWLYDPAIPAFAEEPPSPLSFDGVICCDVLEHVPEADVPDVLDAIYHRARRWVFLSICCRPSSRELPDGRNCHLTIQPRQWWYAAIKGSIKRRAGPKLLGHIVRFT